MIDKVKEILADELSVDIEDITADSDIREDLDADSLDMVQLVMALEDEFDVEIDNAEIKDVKTVGDVVKFIEAKRG